MLHFSPIIASAFNGFSAPQYRWEYFLSLSAGGVAATGLQQIHKITKRQAFITIACTLLFTRFPMLHIMLVSVLLTETFLFLH